MYTINAIIPVIITIASVLKVDSIKFAKNSYDPLGITEPLTNFRLSYNFSTSNIIKINDSLSHTDHIKNGIHKKSKGKVKESSHEVDNKNLHQKQNRNKNETKNDLNVNDIKKNDKIEDKILEVNVTEDKNNIKDREPTTNTNLQHNTKKIYRKFTTH